MATAGSTGGVGEASAEDYEAYETIVRAVSSGIAQGVKEALQKVSTTEGLSETVAEMSKGEAAPDQTESQRLFEGFWNVWQGVDCDLHWRSRAGVPPKSALTVDEVRKGGGETEPGEEQPEFTIGVGIGPFGISATW